VSELWRLSEHDVTVNAKRGTDLDVLLRDAFYGRDDVSLSLDGLMLKMRVHESIANFGPEAKGPEDVIVTYGLNFVSGKKP
jgi:hypothetical protein